MFFLVSVCNNYAFDFNIPMPLHMIFRAVSFEEENIVPKLLTDIHFLGIVNRQHDNGNINFEETVSFLEIYICVDDYNWNSHLHNSVRNWSGKFFFKFLFYVFNLYDFWFTFSEKHC